MSPTIADRIHAVFIRTLQLLISLFLIVTVGFGFGLNLATYLAALLSGMALWPVPTLLALCGMAITTVSTLRTPLGVANGWPRYRYDVFDGAHSIWRHIGHALVFHLSVVGQSVTLWMTVRNWQSGVVLQDYDAAFYGFHLFSLIVTGLLAALPLILEYREKFTDPD